MSQVPAKPVSSASEALLNAGIDINSLKLGRGRSPANLEIAYSRDLAVEDMIELSTTNAGIKAIGIKDIKQSHHQLARLLAQGVLDNIEVSVICGIAPNRIAILKGDPTFVELLDYYKSMEAQQYSVARADMHTRLASLGFDSIETLHNRLADAPDDFSIDQLLKITEATADRTGHGKTATVNHAHEHSISDEGLARIKGALSSTRTLAETDRGALLRLAVERTADEHSEVEEADWSESGGAELREEGGAAPEEAIRGGELPVSSVVPFRGAPSSEGTD